MAEARNFEEYIYGPDGDDRNLIAAIRSAQEQAQAQEIHSMRCRCQITPAGTSVTTTDWNKVFTVESSAEAVQAAISEALIASPGEGFSGKVRISLEEAGRSTNRLASYTRTLRPGVVTRTQAGIEMDDEGNPIQTHAGSLRSHTDDAIRPHVDMTLRALDRGVALMHAGAQMMQSFHAPAPADPAGGQQGLLPDLVRGAVGIASAASGQAPAQQGAAAAYNVVTSGTGYASGSNGRPPSPLPFSPTHRAPSPFALGQRQYGTTSDTGPSLLPDRKVPTSRQLPGPASKGANGSGATLNESSVEAYLRAHPDFAKRLVMQAISEGKTL